MCYREAEIVCFFVTEMGGGFNILMFMKGNSLKGNVFFFAKNIQESRFNFVYGQNALIADLVKTIEI